MEFEWDDEKAMANALKHQVTFDEAKTVFDDPLFVDFFDPEHSLEENRFLLAGSSRTGRLLIVSYAERGVKIRLISAREMTRSERRDYQERN